MYRNKELERARVSNEMRHVPGIRPSGPNTLVSNMKIKNSLKALKGRHRDCQLVRRKGRVYIINKTAPRFKARQG